MIGDSLLRGITEPVELSLSNKFSTYSMVKPGCELKPLLESANCAAESLTQKDAVIICGGSNDFNFNLDKVELTTDLITEFIRTHTHTNIVLANVRIHYDLSYYSQINKGIRSYNKRLVKIADEHKQVTLIEIDVERKYHTRHGLHFNKQGKLLFSNKITQAIYAILGKKPMQNADMNGKHVIQDVSFNHGCEGSSNNKEKTTKSDKKDAGKNGEGNFDQEKRKIASGNREDKSGEEEYNQVNNKVALTKDLKCDDVNKNCQDNVDKNLSESDKVKVAKTHRTSLGKNSERKSDHEKQEATSGKEDNQKMTVTGNSNRDKKLPVTRSDGFLWKV